MRQTLWSEWSDKVALTDTRNNRSFGTTANTHNEARKRPLRKRVGAGTRPSPAAERSCLYASLEQGDTHNDG